MANPNIIGITGMYGNTICLIPQVATSVVFIANPLSSGKILKINNIMATNIDSSVAINTTVSIYSNGSVAQGSAPSGGTAFPLIYALSIPAGAALTIIDKSIYLTENQSIVVTSGTASKISYAVSYEELS